ncbi:hypothetical protein V3C99_014702, partial [Haemonchus contortus]|uniref:Ion_trans domain-containing protein n=1 Tax=Haemonchus contortus TaxID=6289 RepID=A0A7I4YUY7_HAECO
KESGEPQSWGCLIFIVSAITFMNLMIVVVIRILLDSEDEINEPIIKGETREHLTIFLGIFTMTFFFGCWCCFCCGCLVCSWILECPNFLTAASYKFISSHPSIRRRFRKEDEEDIVIDDVVIAAHRIPHHDMRRQPTDLRAYENPIPFEHFMEPEAIIPQPIPSMPRLPLGRMRSHSIDVWYK